MLDMWLLFSKQEWKLNQICSIFLCFCGITFNFFRIRNSVVVKNVHTLKSSMPINQTRTNSYTKLNAYKPNLNQLQITQTNQTSRSKKENNSYLVDTLTYHQRKKKENNRLQQSNLLLLGTSMYIYKEYNRYVNKLSDHCFERTHIQVSDSLLEMKLEEDHCVHLLSKLLFYMLN